MTAQTSSSLHWILLNWHVIIAEMSGWELASLALGFQEGVCTLKETLKELTSSSSSSSSSSQPIPS